MLLGLVLLLGLAVIPLLGGRIARLATLRVRWIPAVAAAFAVQILIVNVFPEVGDDALHRIVHIATYVVIGVVVVRNIRLPGLPVIALGGALNAIAIFANGGVMPADPDALRTAGMTPDPEAFTNSAALADAKVAFLGDVFAFPAWLPAANVFSVGDVLLVLGAWILAHHVCGSRAIGRNTIAANARRASD
jgi:hypothetical protein